MRDIWAWFAAVNGIAAVGAPTVRESIGSNVRWNANGWNLAAVQYLANGTNTYDPANWRTGAMVHILGGSTAVWIRDKWFSKWRQMGEQASFLGFPSANDDGVRQNFQFGCIKIVSGAAIAAQYGVSPCL